MTATQIYALIGLTLAAALLINLGYFFGRKDGKAKGLQEGKEITQAETAKTISELRASLQFIRADHLHLAQHCKRLKASQTFGSKERDFLLDVADKLRIAAATFGALRTGKTITRETLALQDQVLAMAELLKPVAQEDAA
ncbi:MULTISPECIES: hypothetical protein [Pseudomonas]|uniref:hypothetical protein n=1 Tax=Pseudomonas TaxID=286 RepID=UPI0005A7823C|nr:MULTISPECIES: hypothetical protein [Pseudomonas]AZD93133.1 hypothetical protein C4K13_3717 [Pseudomonas chlororaphis subsp. aureofaciens]AZE04168.1 hypothetical protein C4K11_1996 [Pseudomonas chlororaphis subsp. aureofaciens]AZE36648.1 hypothetical protein C4K06_3616 [Pseudomonas chlororaphis subsp. aureofaciens]KAB0532705.1 hypothetical protein F7R16_10680 [Pseudomonas chlororaphis subsp. aureofaciens]TSD26107.1 hypothetical protein FCE86_032110 [Pseudomonas sp. ATCC 13985]